MALYEIINNWSCGEHECLYRISWQCTKYFWAIALKTTNVNLMVALEVSQGVTNVSGIHPPGNTYVCTMSLQQLLRAFSLDQKAAQPADC